MDLEGNCSGFTWVGIYLEETSKISKTLVKITYIPTRHFSNKSRSVIAALNFLQFETRSQNCKKSLLASSCLSVRTSVCLCMQQLDSL